ncbi:MAG: FAD-binding protein [Magnetococcus sp. WYHC-3]
MLPPDAATADKMLPGAALPGGFCDHLTELLGPERFRRDGTSLEAYAWDNTGSRRVPGAVALVENSQEVSAVLVAASRWGVPVTPRGAGSGNVGGCLPWRGGLVLGLQRLNRIVEIDAPNRVAVVEPGVVNADLQRALAPHGLYWPPDPSSARVATVGGNIAMCAAGPGAIRQGVTRDWVGGVTAALMDGRVIHTGGRTSKGVVGYDLTRLLVGSEGTLAVVTQAILRLAPRLEARRLCSAAFATVEAATLAVCDLMTQGDPPLAVEFLDARCLELVRRQGVALPGQAGAMLLLEVGATSDARAEGLMEDVTQRLARQAPLTLEVAADASRARQVWAARYALSPALKQLAPHRINEDVVVPVAALPRLIAGLEALSAHSGIPIVNFGHAGNGNIHVNLLVDPDDAALMSRVEPTLEALFRLVLDLQGTLSGEHGVGLAKKRFLSWELDPDTLALQRGIKALFDPAGLLNPGKIFPEV